MLIELWANAHEKFIVSMTLKQAITGYPLLVSYLISLITDFHVQIMYFFNNNVFREIVL